MGLAKAKRYHSFLIIGAILFMVLFTYMHADSPWHWLFLVAVPLLLIQLFKILKLESEQMDKFLKQLSLTTLLMVICIAISVVIQPYV
jgi:1,4-dihydroxy-2-naphthoate octaprenyltransferase